MRLLAVITALVFIPLLMADDPQASGKKVLGPAEASKRAKEAEVTVEMEVKSTGISEKNGHWFLNSETDYKAPENFQVLIPKTVVEKLKDIKDPKAEYNGKTVRVTGYLSMHTNFQGKQRPQIVVHDAKKLTIVTK